MSVSNRVLTFEYEFHKFSSYNNVFYDFAAGNRVNDALRVTNQPGYFSAPHDASAGYRHILYGVVLRLRGH